MPLDTSFLPPLGNLVFVTYQKVESFPAHTSYAFDYDNMKYEISSQILYHVLPPGQYCHPETTGLATGLVPS